MADLVVDGSALSETGTMLMQVAGAMSLRQAALSGCGSAVVAAAAHESETVASMLALHLADQVYQAGQAIAQVGDVLSAADDALGQIAMPDMSAGAAS